MMVHVIHVTYIYIYTLYLSDLYRHARDSTVSMHSFTATGNASVASAALHVVGEPDLTASSGGFNFGGTLDFISEIP